MVWKKFMKKWEGVSCGILKDESVLIGTWQVEKWRFFSIFWSYQSMRMILNWSRCFKIELEVSKLYFEFQNWTLSFKIEIRTSSFKIEQLFSKMLLEHQFFQKLMFQNSQKTNKLKNKP